MEIKSIFKEEFEFLIKEFKFHIIKEVQDKFCYEIIYLNRTTGVKILYEYRESYIFIMLYRLENGKLVLNPLIIDINSILYGYSLDDIVNLYNPADLIKPSYEYREESIFFDKKVGFRLYVRQFAKNLKIYSKDVLLGNFSIFENLEMTVKNRIRE